MSEATIHLASLTAEKDSDRKPSIACCYTVEVGAELVGSSFHVLDRIHTSQRALLLCLREAIYVLPPIEVDSISIVSRYEHLIRLGSSAVTPLNYRRQWTEIRHRLSGFQTVWKLAADDDERQEALTRCLRALLADRSLAGPRLVKPSRRERKAIQKQHALSDDSSVRAHNNVVPRIEASAA